MLKVRSLQINYILNALRVISSALVGIVIMPHITRSLGVVAVGKVEFALTFINYFILFSALGIPVYGLREIAKNRDDIFLRTKTFVELILILVITTIISYLLLFILLFVFGIYQHYFSYIIILTPLIFLTNIGADWYFQGVEDQLFITVRTVFIRLVGFLGMFFFVRSPADVYTYSWLLLLVLGGANLFNFIFIFKTINLRHVKFKDVNLRTHIKPVMVVFIAAISINIYVQLDKILIGSIKGPASVAYYSISNKIVRFAIEFITIIGMVMMPRLSSVYSANSGLYRVYLTKAFYLINILSIPASVFIFLFADKIILIMAGGQFTPAIQSLKILAPLCFVVGIAYYYGFLVLYTQQKEKIYTVAVVTSAIFSLVLNYWLIIYYDFIGASITALLAEILAIVVMIWLSKNNAVLVNVLTLNFLKILGAGLVMLTAFSVLKDLTITANPILQFAIQAVLFGSFYAVLLVVMKEQLVQEKLLKAFKRK